MREERGRLRPRVHRIPPAQGAPFGGRTRGQAVRAPALAVALRLGDSRAPATQRRANPSELSFFMLADLNLVLTRRAETEICFSKGGNIMSESRLACAESKPRFSVFSPGVLTQIKRHPRGSAELGKKGVP